MIWGRGEGERLLVCVFLEGDEGSGGVGWGGGLALRSPGDVFLESGWFGEAAAAAGLN